MINLMELAVKYKAMLILGLKVTVVVSILAVVLGLILGIVLAIMRTRRIKILKAIAVAYVEFIRGTPVMIQLVMVYYGPAIIGLNYPDIPIFNGDISSDRFIAAVIALGINSGALICEIVRSGIQSIDKGQTEAALSLGLSGAETMRRIILPQAIRNILPALGNEFVNMIKTSSQVTIIGLADLMYVSNLIRGQSYRAFAPFVIVAVMYFVLTFAVSNLVKVYERKLNKGRA